MQGSRPESAIHAVGPELRTFRHEHAQLAIRAIGAGNHDEAAWHLYRGWFVAGHDGDHTFGDALRHLGGGQMPDYPSEYARQAESA